MPTPQTMLRGLPALLAAALVTGTVSAQPASASTRTDRIREGFQITAHQRGDRYGYGAEGPHRFDCSGLSFYSYRKAGFRHVPRSSDAQARHMNRIRKSSLRPGDFVFFYDGAATSGNVYHMGVFAGFENGHRIIIHSPNSGERVQRDPIWTRSWFAGTLRGL